MKFENLFKKIFYTIVISPQKVSLIEIIVKNGSFIPINKVSIEESIFKEGEIDRYSLTKAISELKNSIHKKSGELSAFIILNLPMFFVQSFVVYTTEVVNLRDALENKIKQELPINLNKYIWNYFYSPLLKNKVFVVFYNKDVVNEITNCLIENKILPFSTTHILYPIFDFIRNSFSLYYDNSYQFYILSNNVLTSASYEVGVLQNIYCEFTKENLNPILKRLIDSNIRNSKLPLDIVYITSDEDLELDEEILKNYKIFNINKITNLSTEEIAAISLVEGYVLKRKESYQEFKVIDLSKERIIYELIQSLKLSIWGLIILSLIINSFTYAMLYFINQNNQQIKKQAMISFQPSISFQEIENIVSILQKYNSSYEPFVEKIEKKFYNLKDYRITQAYFTRETGKIIIEEADVNKRNQIKENIEKIYPNVQINQLYNGLEINFPNY